MKIIFDVGMNHTHKKNVPIHLEENLFHQITFSRIGLHFVNLKYDESYFPILRREIVVSYFLLVRNESWLNFQILFLHMLQQPFSLSLMESFSYYYWQQFLFPIGC